MTHTTTPRRDEPGRMGQLVLDLFSDTRTTIAPHPTQEIDPTFPILSRHWPGFPPSSEQIEEQEAA